MPVSMNLPLKSCVYLMVLLLSAAVLALWGSAAAAAPARPAIAKPGDGWVDVGLNPSLEASSYTGSNAQKAAEWQVDDWHGQDLWNDLEWSRSSPSAENTTVVNTSNGTFAGSLAGRTSLDANETYFWRVRYQDSADVWSAWSEYGLFVTATSTWYLAEGSTEGGMETWVLVMNPGDVNAVVDVEFMTGNGLVEPDGLQNLSIAPNSRVSFNAGAYVTSYDVSTRVTASAGTIVCERAMYGGGRRWGHDSIGATTPSSTWYMAEGATDGGFETWVLVMNPGSTPVSVDLDFMTSTGIKPGPRDYAVQAGSRVSFNVGDYVTDYNVSTKLSGSGDVICERAMYGNGGEWGHDSIGATSPRYGWLFAEGCTLGGMETWVLVQNPVSYAQQARIYVMDGSGESGYIPVSLAAYSRASINLGLYVQSYNISAIVLAWNESAGTEDEGGKIICERAMYDSSRTWGHDSVGSSEAYPLWVLPEGCTADGMETWVLVQNPTSDPGSFYMIFMTDKGLVMPEELGNVSVAPFSRVSINVGDYVDSFDVSTWVEGDVRLVCERSMYGEGGGWAHNSAGYMLGAGGISAACTEPVRRFGAASSRAESGLGIEDIAESMKDWPRLDPMH